MRWRAASPVAKTPLAVLFLLLGVVPSNPARGLGGQGTGLTATGVVCRNLTSGQTVRVTEGLLAWDCATLGLVFSPGDRVVTSIRGLLPALESWRPLGTQPADFVSHSFPVEELEGSGVVVGDLDGDGDLDVVSKDAFRWFENLGTPAVSFAKHRFDPATNLDASHAILFDVNGDGAVDVVSALELPSPDGLVWWENQGGAPPTFVQHPIDFREGWKITHADAGDLDLDGRLDLIGSDLDEDSLVWQENVIGLRLTVSGLSVQAFLCRNRSTGQTVQVETTETMVDCEASGLTVHPGDELEVRARGVAE